MKHSMRRLCVPVAVLALLALWHLAGPVQSQEKPEPLQAAQAGSRFTFDVVESLAPQFQGDTFSHRGRSGLEDVRPNVALGDPVFRGDHRVGVVSAIVWDRGSRTLEIEFNPNTAHRVATGDSVWVALNPTPGEKM